jgi:predicted XRE-type DNA-binding protein
MEIQTFDNVVEALADTPAQVAKLKARSQLLAALKAGTLLDLSYEVAASRLGITRPVSTTCCRQDGKILARRVGEPSGGLGA